MGTKTKLVGAVVVAAAAAYVGASWYVGKKIENVVHTETSRINKLIATNPSMSFGGSALKIEVLNYDRGLMSSNVDYQIIIAPSDQDPISILVKDKLQHGPLPITAVFSGHIAPLLAYSKAQLVDNDVVSQWFNAANGKTPITAKSFISFDGSVDSQVHLAALDYVDPDGSEIKMAATKADINYKKGTDTVTIDSHLPSLELLSTEAHVLVQVKDSHFTGSLIGLDSAKEQTSQGKVTIAQITVDADEQMTAVIDGLSMQSSYELKNDLLNSHANYHFEKLLVDNHYLGKMDLDIEANQVSYPAFMQLSEFSESENIEDQEALRKIMQTFFAAGPELKVNNLSWANESGASQIKIDLRPAATFVDEVDAEQLSHYMKAFSVDAQVSRKMVLGFFKEENFASSLFDMMFTRFVAQGVETGLLVYDEAAEVAKLAVDFNAATNSLTLNGSPITEEQFFYALMLLQMSTGL